MDIRPEEAERIEAVQRHIKGEKSIGVYTSMGRSKYWFNKWLKRYKSGRKKWYKDQSKRPQVLSQKTDKRTEQIVVDIRKMLMDGNDDSMRYSFVGAEAIQFHMEEMGFEPSEIPSLSTIKRIIKRNKLRVNKKERYKRVRSKGRYTILKPKYIGEMHQIDFVGPRYIKGYGAINSLHLKDVVERQVAGNQYHGKSMNNVIDFLLDHWTHHPIPKYLQVDNGMCFAGDYKHPKTFSRFIKLALYVGIEVVFIAPSRPWMNGTIEEFNKQFEVLFWSKEQFQDLDDIKDKSQIFYQTQNEFNRWKLRREDMKAISPRKTLPENFAINVNNLPMVSGKIHFIRVVDSKGRISVLNENFTVGEEYIGEYVWATIETRKDSLTVYYKDENLIVREIRRFSYEMPEKVYNRRHSIFKSG